MATKLKERASFFSAGEQEMIMNAYEEYKTIIMAKSNTATAARARQEAVYGAVYGGISMYVCITTSATVLHVSEWDKVTSAVMTWVNNYRLQLPVADL